MVDFEDFENTDKAEGFIDANFIVSYYGSPKCYKWEDSYYMQIEPEASGGSHKEISEEFYNAWVKEFGGG